MTREDNNGFVNFPVDNNPRMIKHETGKTLIYIVSFDPQDLSNKAYYLSKIHINMPGSFVGDDVLYRSKASNVQMTIDDLIEMGKVNNDYDKLYFPDLNKKDLDNVLSIPMITSICVGWSDFTYEVKDQFGFWVANFRDLTHEGKKLYYAIKKLHNTKEVRILTFNNC